MAMAGFALHVAIAATLVVPFSSGVPRNVAAYLHRGVDSVCLLQRRANLSARAGPLSSEDEEDVAAVSCTAFFKVVNHYNSEELLGRCLARLPEGTCYQARRVLGAQRPWSRRAEGEACHLVELALVQQRSPHAAKLPWAGSGAQNAERQAAVPAQMLPNLARELAAVTAMQQRRHRRLRSDGLSLLDQTVLDKDDYEHAKKVGAVRAVNCSNITLGNNSNNETGVLIPDNSTPSGCWIAEDYLEGVGIPHGGIKGSTTAPPALPANETTETTTTSAPGNETTVTTTTAAPANGTNSSSNQTLVNDSRVLVVLPASTTTTTTTTTPDPILSGESYNPLDYWFNH